MDGLSPRPDTVPARAAPCDQRFLVLLVDAAGADSGAVTCSDGGGCSVCQSSAHTEGCLVAATACTLLSLGRSVYGGERLLAEPAEL